MGTGAVEEENYKTKTHHKSQRISVQIFLGSIYQKIRWKQTGSFPFLLIPQISNWRVTALRLGLCGCGPPESQSWRCWGTTLGPGHASQVLGH